MLSVQSHREREECSVKSRAAMLHASTSSDTLCTMGRCSTSLGSEGEIRTSEPVFRGEGELQSMSFMHEPGRLHSSFHDSA